MASIAQKQLFVWQEIEELGDLERLVLTLKYLPDEELVTTLEKKRNKGINKYPIRAVWNSIIAGVVYEHISIESLRRELKRNAELRGICGFNLFHGIKAVPSPRAYSHFFKNLFKHEELIEKMFNKLVDDIRKELPDYGKIQAFDGKAIDTHANGKKKQKSVKKTDGRRDSDADWGKKIYKGKKEDGTPWEKVKSWFGYKLHLIVDATYELPIAYEVTKASSAESPQMHKLYKEVEKQHKELLKRCEYGLGDRGYDDGKLHSRLWDNYKIKPVIDIRNCWKDGEETKQIPGKWNIVYNYKGQVFCICSRTGKQREMAYKGFEKNRETLKYSCPAESYGYECYGKCKCAIKKQIRIPMETDKRIFTPLARSSYKWKKIYKNRTAVERVNSRLDVSFGFERHYIRGLKKMKIRCGLALCIMLAMALGRIREKQKELMRSLVRVA
jgi:hypothetical protein